MHEILMIAREAVHNSVLHGSPSTIHLTVAFERDVLTLEIADDGRGFDAAAVYSAGKRHFGLMGMRERAARLKGNLDIRSTPGSGANVVIRVPRRTAAATKSIAEQVGTL